MQPVSSQCNAYFPHVSQGHGQTEQGPERLSDSAGSHSPVNCLCTEYPQFKLILGSGHNWENPVPLGDQGANKTCP